jgi:phthiocerol/phenolphthiocerol synthesis type-I polyketide synthase E
MAAGLYQTEPVFRTHLDRCAAILEAHLGLDIREIIYPGGPSSDANEGQQLDMRALLRRDRQPGAPTESPLNRTLISHPALFAVEYALAQLWLAWGVVPEAMIGYSLGEYVAACLAGVFSLEDALRLVAERARLIEELPAGAMLAVSLGPEELRPLLGRHIHIAAMNARSVCVVAGPAEAVAELQCALAQRGVAARALSTTHAFHTPMMAEAAAPLIELLRSIRLSPPSIPYISNVSGTWITAAEATDPAYWARHLCQAVRFADGVRELWRESDAILLELGPGTSRSSLALQASADPMATQVALSSLPHAIERQPDTAQLHRALGQLWAAGATIDWAGYHAGQRRRRVSLPAYPFERQRFWVESRLPIPMAMGQAGPADQPLLGEPGQPPETAAGRYARPTLRAPYVAPTTEAEQRIAQIWQDLLGIAEVGIHDNFFQLGGHSLSGTQLVSQLRAVFQVDVPLRSIFEAPTVAELGLLVEDLLIAELEMSE